MKKNVGKTDKIIRVIVALIAVYLGYTINGWFYVITAIALFTVATSRCVPYSWFKISTIKKK